jgi:hypothetical protein
MNITQIISANISGAKVINYMELYHNKKIFLRLCFSFVSELYCVNLIGFSFFAENGHVFLLLKRIFTPDIVSVQHFFTVKSFFEAL